MEIWKVCVNALETKEAKHFIQLMSAGDIIHKDLPHQSKEVRHP